MRQISETFEMDSITRNVYMAIFLLVLGIVMLITGIGLYFSEDPEASGEAKWIELQ